MLDREGRIVHFNRACERATGCARDDLLGRDARETMAAADVERLLAGARVTASWRVAGGVQRTVAWASEPYAGPDGAVAGVVAVGIDVTERERRGAKLRLLMEEQAALRRVAMLVVAGAAPMRIFQAVTEEACRLLHIRSAVMQRFEDDGTAIVVGRYSEHRPGGFAIGEVVPLETGLSATAVARTGRATRVEYAREEGGVAARMRALGFRSTVAVPVSVEGRTWGALIVALREDETLPEDGERRLAGFADLVAVALASADAREALEASRARIVEAGDAARRRLERNLHDGAQQRLVTLALTLRMARSRLGDDAEGAAALLTDAGEELTAALDELRELAHGLHPALLTDRGLAPALSALAARAPFPVELSVELSSRLPEAVEAAAYYLASEALANAAKHADPSAATITVRLRGGVASIEIADDGAGGADVAGGSGLRGLVDRVEAIGGRLEITSPPGAGTVLRAELPVRAPATLPPSPPE